MINCIECGEELGVEPWTKVSGIESGEIVQEGDYIHSRCAE